MTNDRVSGEVRPKDLLRPQSEPARTRRLFLCACRQSIELASRSLVKFLPGFSGIKPFGYIYSIT